MYPKDTDKRDPGFLLSLNLMVFGGALLLFSIISGNRLLNHYLSNELDHTRGMLYSVNIMESESFKIYSPPELYLTWLAFLVSFTGLAFLIHRLIKTWKH